ncbi:MAG: hypothetical protein LJE62_01210, partial [Silicimonas sp.]|nr:hypothetical protein [Silicimonas sp.]
MFDFRTIAAAAVIVVSGQAASAGALMEFDVAEDLSRFIFAETPVHPDGMPAFGNGFVTQGYIYPSGTLDGDVEGTNADGSPVWPELVLGTWTCDGYFVGDGGHTTTGNIVITRQVFEFADGSLIITQGPEIADTNSPIIRPITGATGEFADAGPVMEQTLLGMSDGFGVRLQFEIGPDSEHAALQ